MWRSAACRWRWSAANALLVTLVGGANALLLTAVGFTVSALLTLTVLRPALAASRPAGAPRSGYLSEFRDRVCARRPPPSWSAS